MKNLDPKNKVTQPNPKEMLDIGRSFFQASQKLFAPEISSGSTLMCVVPAVVSLAFSNEILLKCFLQLRNVAFPKSHSTLELFNCLSVSDQELIMRKTGFSQLEEIKEEIKKTADSFEHWRYAFETKYLPFSSKFPTSLSKALLKIFEKDLKDLFPLWRGKTLVVDRCDD